MLAQRLTRRLCPRCRVAQPASDQEIQALAEEYCFGTALKPSEQVDRWRATYGALMTYKPVGCRICSGIGYAGRLALFELLVASPEIKRLILRHGTVEQVAAQARAEGMRTLKQDGIEKVLQGLTTIDQVRAASN